MIRKVRKNGSSYIVALTPYAMEELELKEGEKVDVKVKNKQVVITKIEIQKGDK